MGFGRPRRAIHPVGSRLRENGPSADPDGIWRATEPWRRQVSRRRGLDRRLGRRHCANRHWAAALASLVAVRLDRTGVRIRARDRQRLRRRRVPSHDRCGGLVDGGLQGQRQRRRAENRHRRRPDPGRGGAFVEAQGRRARSAMSARSVAGIAVVSVLLACSTYGLTGAGESADWSAGTAAHVTVVGALTRTFLVHVPSHRRLSSSGLPRPWPLVIVLHGSGGDASAVERQSGMDSLADAQRFLVAYPNGTGGVFDLYPSDWNAGTCCGAANRDNIDDLGFIAALIKTVAVHVPLD